MASMTDFASARLCAVCVAVAYRIRAVSRPEVVTRWLSAVEMLSRELWSALRLREEVVELCRRLVACVAFCNAVMVLSCSRL